MKAFPVARAVRLGPATRLEDHSGRTSLPGRRLRAQLRSSLRTVRTALNVALTAIAADAGGHASLLEMSASAATNDLDQDDALGIADLKQSAYSVAELRSATLCHLLLLFERIPILGSERGQETLSELLAALTWTLRNEADTIGAAVRLSFAPLPPAVDRTAQTRSSTSALLLQRVSILQHHIVGLSHKLSLLVEPWTTGDWDRVQDPHTVLLAHWMAIERDLHDAVEMGRAVHTAILDDDHQSPTSAPPAAAAAAGSCGDKVASVDGAQSTTTASDSLTAKSTGENESGQTTADDSVELVFEAYTGPLIAEGAAKKPKMSRAERIVARKAADATQRTTTPSASSSFDERLLLLRELRDVLGKRPSLSRAADDGPNNSAETLSPNGGLGD